MAPSSDSSCDGFNDQYDGFGMPDVASQAVVAPSSEDVFYVLEKHRRMKKDIRRRKTRRRPIRLQKCSRSSRGASLIEEGQRGINSDPPIPEPIHHLLEQGTTRLVKGQKSHVARNKKSIYRRNEDKRTTQINQREAEKEMFRRDEEEEDAGVDSGYENDDEDNLIGKEVLTSSESLPKDLLVPMTKLPIDPIEAITKSLHAHQLTKAEVNVPFEMVKAQRQEQEQGENLAEVNNLEDEMNYEFISRVQENNRKLKSFLEPDQQQEEEKEDDSSHSCAYENLPTSVTQDGKIEQWLRQLSFSFSEKEIESVGNILSRMDTFSETESVPDLVCGCL